MASSDERMKILKMIQDGKITAAEGLQLLEAIGASRVEQAGDCSRSDSVNTKDARWLRVKVTDTNTGKARVNIRLPLSVVTAGMKMGARFSPEIDGLDMSVLSEFIRSGETGKVVDLFDELDGEHVEVFVE